MATLSEIVAKVKELGMPGIALTDHGNMSGVYKFWKICKQENIKPIIGCEFYVANGSRHTKDNSERGRTHLTVLAKNLEGYKNLCKLSTISYTEGFYYKPRIDLESLEEHKEGLIILSGCSSSAISEAIREDDTSKAIELATWFKKVFSDDFYLEKQFHGCPFAPKYWDQQHLVNEYLDVISKKLNIKCVISCDTHYINKEDTEIHEMLLSIGTARNYSDPDRMSLRDFDLSVQDPNEIIKHFPEEAENTIEILDKCDFGFDQMFDFKNIILPKFCDTPEEEYELLKQLTWEGCRKLYNIKNYKDMETITFEGHSLKERISYELDIIKKMGYVGYLLIVQDFVNWAKNQGILVGHGRGSASASVVSYCIGITSVNPLVKGMVFERWLNEERYSMPDIDIDFQDNRRQEVIDYLKTRYGEDKICHVVVLSRLKAKSAVKDVARALELPFQDSLELTKNILDNPMNVEKYLPESYNEEFVKEKMKDSKYQEIFKFAEKLEGKIRQFGQHACGIIISDQSLDNLIPLMVMNDQITSQFEHKDLEEMMFLKYDFLGLSNLTIVDHTLKQIEKNTGTKVDFYKIPLDDKNVFNAYASGRIKYSFTFGTKGMQSTLKQIKCDSMNDLIATNALFRPGPMAFIKDYAEVKSGTAPFHALCKEIEEETKWTYGVVAYQEQFLSIVRKMSGFSYGKADILRRAMAKKKKDLMDSMKIEFIEGCQKNGIDESIAHQFWSQTDAWVNYGFNFAHAYTYAVIGYITGWLEYYYPSEYLSACMQAKSTDKDELPKLIQIAKLRNIKIHAPSIKRKMYFNSDGNSIYFGLNGIKGVGENDITGDWKTFEEFLLESGINAGKLKALIEAGALDCYEDRKLLYHNYDKICAFIKRRKIIKKRLEDREEKLNVDQIPLFDDKVYVRNHNELSTKFEFDILPPIPVNDLKLLILEKERLGMFVSGTPVSIAEKFIKGKRYRFRNVGVIQNLNRFISRAGNTINKFDVLTELSEYEVMYSGRRQLKENDIILLQDPLRPSEKATWIRDMHFEYVHLDENSV